MNLCLILPAHYMPLYMCGEWVSGYMCTCVSESVSRCCVHVYVHVRGCMCVCVWGGGGGCREKGTENQSLCSQLRYHKPMSLLVHVHVHPSVTLPSSSPDTMFCITNQTCEHSVMCWHCHDNDYAETSLDGGVVSTFVIL